MTSKRYSIKKKSRDEQRPVCILATRYRGERPDVLLTPEPDSAKRDAVQVIFKQRAMQRRATSGMYLGDNVSRGETRRHPYHFSLRQASVQPIRIFFTRPPSMQLDDAPCLLLVGASKFSTPQPSGRGRTGLQFSQLSTFRMMDMGGCGCISICLRAHKECIRQHTLAEKQKAQGIKSRPAPFLHVHYSLALASRLSLCSSLPLLEPLSAFC